MENNTMPSIERVEEAERVYGVYDVFGGGCMRCLLFDEDDARYKLCLSALFCLIG